MPRPSQSSSRRSSRSQGRGGESSSRSRRGGFTLFEQSNYLFIALGVAAVIAGYGLMYAESELHGPLSLYVAPVVTLGGYALVAYGILHAPRSAGDEASDASENA